MLTALTLAITDDDQTLADNQGYLEHRALRLAAAWQDFDTVENIAGEISRRFGAIDPRDFGVLRLHREPIFIALQTAAVTLYVRPFTVDGGLERLAAKYATYDRPEWKQLHAELCLWRHRTSGESSGRDRQFMIAPRETRDPAWDEFVVGEASSVLEPMSHFTLLRTMCASRKALIWPDLQAALAACYPFIKHPVLLTGTTPADRESSGFRRGR
jgi:hypothetical protein